MTAPATRPHAGKRCAQTRAQTRAALPAPRRARSAALRATLSAAALSALIACDQGRAREVDAAQLVTTPDALRATLTARGAQRLLERRVAQDQALTLRLEASPSTALAQVTIGPLELALTPGQLQVQPDIQGLRVAMTWEDLLVVLPTRHLGPRGLELCRWRVQVRLAQALGGWGPWPEQPEQLRAHQDLSVTLERPRVNLVGACEAAQALSDAQRAALDEELARRLERALERAIQDALALELLGELGMIQRGLELTRQSNFPNRRGQLLIASGLSGPVQPSPQGLTFGLSFAALATLPSACSPPVELPPLTLATPPSPTALGQADLALAMPLSALERQLHVAIRAGFACQGLQQIGLIEDGSLSTRELLLEELNLPTALLGPRAHLTASPGALPRVSADPLEGTLIIEWPDLSVELYATALGAQVKLLTLRADARLRARHEPTRTDRLALRAETMQVSQVSLQSEWLEAPAAPQTLERWARRILLLAMSDALQAPLPLLPGSPLRLDRVQLTSGQIILQMTVEPP